MLQNRVSEQGLHCLLTGISVQNTINFFHLLNYFSLEADFRFGKNILHVKYIQIDKEEII